MSETSLPDIESDLQAKHVDVPSTERDLSTKNMDLPFDKKSFQTDHKQTNGSELNQNVNSQINNVSEKIHLFVSQNKKIFFLV
jgi:hypothetical protein